MQTYLLAGGEKITNVHQSWQCQGQDRNCSIHRMTDHSMRGFPQHFRADRGLMERICDHGIGHPDPDDVEFLVSMDGESALVHGCDGCCR